MSEHVCCTVNEILDRYERDCLHDLAARTQVDYRKHIRHLRHWFGARVAAELKPRDFSTFIEVTKGRFVRNKQLAVLSAAFTQAVKRWYWLDANVVRDVWRHPSKPRDRLITDAEFASCRAMAALRIRLAMDLALLTGQRQGDLLTLKWSQILDDGAIHLQQSKTGKRLAIKLSPELKRVLGRCASLPTFGSPREYVILNESGRPYTSDGFRAIWQRNMRAWVRRGNARFTFHDIRALCATKCATIEEAMYLLGHSNIAMTRRVYRRGIEYVQPLRLAAAA